MFEGFSPAAREIVDASQVRAAALGQEAAGTEHMLLALAETYAGVASEVLAELDVPAERVQTVAVSRLGRGVSHEWDLRHRWTNAAKRMLEYSLRQRLERGDSEIRPEHMLLAAPLIEEGGASEILRSLGVGFEQIKAQLDERRSA